MEEIAINNFISNSKTINKIKIRGVINMVETNNSASILRLKHFHHLTMIGESRQES